MMPSEEDNEALKIWRINSWKNRIAPRATPFLVTTRNWEQTKYQTASFAPLRRKVTGFKKHGKLMVLPYLLHLETATTNCSVAVSKGEELLYCKESNSDFRHSDCLHLFIEEALAQAGVKINALDVV